MKQLMFALGFCLCFSSTVVAQQSAKRDTSPSEHSQQVYAAESIWGQETMRKARRALHRSHGSTKLFWFQADRLEYSANRGEDGYLWDIQASYGNDVDKFYFKSEAEGHWDENAEQTEVQALWSHAIDPFFDLQVGIRQDLTGPSRSHLVLGIQGVAPYHLEVDAAIFLSHKGDFTARLEAEHDYRLTQQWIFQSRVEFNLSAQNIPELGIGSGLDSLELGFRLRFEIAPEFAPYIGIEREWKIDDSRAFAREDGEATAITHYVIGIRFWF